VKPVLARTIRSLQSNILAGILTIGPLFVTYLIFSFVSERVGQGWNARLIQLFAAYFPAAWLSQPWLRVRCWRSCLRWFLLYVAGRVTSLVIGRQAFNLFEALLERLPFVAKVYTSVRQLLDTMMSKKEKQPAGGAGGLSDCGAEEHRISDQDADGFDQREAARGGAAAQCDQPDDVGRFCRFCPWSGVIETSLTMEQAMSMLMTGGAVGPETIRYSQAEIPAKTDETAGDARTVDH